MITIPPPGPHGGDAQRIAAALGVHASELLELSATLNPVAPDPVPLLRRHLDAIGAYPDPLAATRALAETIGIDAERVLLTNGGSEAIGLLRDVIGGRCEEPAFSLYPRGEHGPMWRSNPHSPLGFIVSEAPAPGDVMDEAFWPMVRGTWTSGDADRGAFVVGSLTKLFACPGLRLGYLLAPATDHGVEVLAAARARQPEWAVSGLGTAALGDLLATAELERWAAEMAQLRAELVAVIESAGFTTLAGVAPWVLVRTGGLDLRRELALLGGVIVRDCATFGLDGVIRIALPRPDHLERVAAAFAAAGARLDEHRNQRSPERTS